VQSRGRRIALAVAVVVLSALLVVTVSGYFLFTRPQGDPLTKADAIVVLGGEDDGRMQYGLQLARQGYADNVVISDSYRPGYPPFVNACNEGTATITVTCFRPSPYTTRGEAMFVQRLAAENQWKHVIVVSWNFHMVRARYIFDQCFTGTVTMHPVPRTYDYPLTEWIRVYGYQYIALLKAFVLGCDRG
jgi:uncharacterized SAM-binding protein YcdF (DUF218 family)